MDASIAGRPSYLTEIPGSGEKKTEVRKPYFRRGSIRHGRHDTAGSEKAKPASYYTDYRRITPAQYKRKIVSRPMPYIRSTAGPLPATELAAQKYDGTIRMLV
ncbi:MAG: hypothetical protein U0T56_12985 [Ferruginibacter sp.]